MKTDNDKLKAMRKSRDTWQRKAVKAQRQCDTDVRDYLSTFAAKDNEINRLQARLVLLDQIEKLCDELPIMDEAGNPLAPDIAPVAYMIDRIAELKEVVDRLPDQLKEDSATLDHVLQFAAMMEAKLDLNRHKGDVKGWRKMDVYDLWMGFCKEKDEMIQAMINAIPPEEILKEAADVANFAMMLADKCKFMQSEVADASH